jgi:hypothetical protein
MLTNASCTIYHKSPNGFETVFIPLCYWAKNRTVVAGTSGITNSDELTVLIPMSDITQNLFIRPKDRIVKGDFPNLPIDELVKLEDCYTVQAVDTFDMGLRHWEVHCK